LPLVLQKPTASAYTTRPKNSFLSNKVTSTELVTKLNNKDEVKTEDVSYVPESSFIKAEINADNKWVVE
jgi:hypothetical protein